MLRCWSYLFIGLSKVHIELELLGCKSTLVSSYQTCAGQLRDSSQMAIKLTTYKADQLSAEQLQVELEDLNEVTNRHRRTFENKF